MSKSPRTFLIVPKPTGQEARQFLETMPMELIPGGLNELTYILSSFPRDVEAFVQLCLEVMEQAAQAAPEPLDQELFDRYFNSGSQSHILLLLEAFHDAYGPEMAEHLNNFSPDLIFDFAAPCAGGVVLEALHYDDD